jgi:hypothetical protein
MKPLRVEEVDVKDAASMPTMHWDTLYTHLAHDHAGNQIDHRRRNGRDELRASSDGVMVNSKQGGRHCQPVNNRAEYWSDYNCDLHVNLHEDTSIVTWLTCTVLIGLHLANVPTFRVFTVIYELLLLSFDLIIIVYCHAKQETGSWIDKGGARS